MDTGSYRTEWWNGREVMPGSSMRFVQNRGIPKPIRADEPNLTGNLAPLFDRDKSGKITKPRPYRPGEPDLSIGGRLSGGDKRERGRITDELLKRTRKPRRNK